MTGSNLDAEALQAVRGLARAARILERTSNELSMAQYRVLAAVAAGEDRAARIAERLELGRPAVSSAVEALSAKGYLKRLEARGDQRAFDLQVTQSGFAALEVVERDMTIALYELCARVSDGESLLRSLAILGAAVDAVHEERRAVGRGSSQ